MDSLIKKIVHQNKIQQIIPKKILFYKIKKKKTKIIKNCLQHIMLKELLEMVLLELSIKEKLIKPDKQLQLKKYIKIKDIKIDN